MKQPRARYMLIALVAAVISAMIAFAIYQYVRRQIIIDVQELTIKKITDEITEVQELGLRDTDPAVRALRDRLATATEQRENARNSWFVVKRGSATPSPLHTHLQGLITLHTKMLNSYRRDLRDYRKRDVSDSSALVAATRNKITNLQRKLAKLTGNLQIAETDAAAVQLKLTELRNLYTDAIAQCKDELRTLARAGAAANDPRVRLLQEHLSTKLHCACQIDQLSQQ